MNDDDWELHKINVSDVYDQANYSGALQSWVMRQSHKILECDFNDNDHFENVLEIGSGTGEHFQYINHSFSKYTLSDADPKILEYAKQKLTKNNNYQVYFDVQAGSELTYEDGSFDRVIATHVLEHIYYPHLALKEWCRVLKDGGVLSVVIPTDPGLAWRIGKMLGPRRNAAAKGIPYDYIMAREHVNPCLNIIAILRHFFPEGIERWWPLRLPLVDANLFCAFNVKISK